MKIHTLTIVGVGLMGGSIGLAVKKRGLAQVVRGAGQQLDRLEQARQLGALDEICLDPGAAADADFIIVCTPVDQVAGQVLALAPHCRSGTLITDVGSTKAIIVQTAEDVLLREAGDRPMNGSGLHFVGSHPLAGSEKQGPQFADADLFQERWTIVTKTAQTDGLALSRVMAFWQDLGAKVRVMEPGEHDRALAMTSHLPHLAASAISGILPPQWRELTAAGFRDATRIAAGDAELWSAIFAHNRPSLLEALQLFEDRLGQFRQALERADRQAIQQLLLEGKTMRDSL